MSMLEDLIWRSAWTLLTVLTVARVAYGVQFQSVGAVGPAMVQDLSLAYASLGTLVGAYSMLGVVLALPAGWLIAQLGTGGSSGGPPVLSSADFSLQRLLAFRSHSLAGWSQGQAEYCCWFPCRRSS
jgi:hypothetical protein